MASRRDTIRMTDQEVLDFLEIPKNISVATHGLGGTIHLTALWYCLIGQQVAFWTYAKSQKIANLRRSPQISLLAEDGRDYSELRGVEVMGEAEIVADPSFVARVGEGVFVRHVADPSEDVRNVFLSSAPKRLAVVVHPLRVTSWDHRKLGGQY